ncbi:hypothetical protein PHYBOEH_009945 [Phytophthora boehmeriae]|uniref:RxLR effector protein n=1 Tax=Phytophthora boehmeriae TaxID=109152 RepID=A0A8T1VPX5_9STRA|nr:hypothetical protein PHYBOEH_009945 [Phytophthora boehmeriae]
MRVTSLLLATMSMANFAANDATAGPIPTGYVGDASQRHLRAYNSDGALEKEERGGGFNFSGLRKFAQGEASTSKAAKKATKAFEEKAAKVQKQADDMLLGDQHAALGYTTWSDKGYTLDDLTKLLNLDNNPQYTLLYNGYMFRKYMN